jgi:hypothetical protein
MAKKLLNDFSPSVEVALGGKWQFNQEWKGEFVQ